MHPNARPVAMETISVKMSAWSSTWNSRKRGIYPGTSVLNNLTPAAATNSPPTPPRQASVKLSVNNCRISRIRPAPSAARTASSCCLRSVRARVRFATLAQTISNTNPMRCEQTKQGPLQIFAPVGKLRLRVTHPKTQPTGPTIPFLAVDLIGCVIGRKFVRHGI